ncbi:MAG: hypothetical protein RLZZ127_2451 [Planctomycetota bacterium]|jgi:prepilin-type N-terminal cleavage/methylation domain-containing protein
MRRGFTLVEILVSLGIFAVIGTLIVTVLFSATRLFSGAEAAKAAGDEAVTVLALLRNDLSRIVPGRDGGWFHARILDGSGNGCVAWIAVNENPEDLVVPGRGAAPRGGREIIAWWTISDGTLRRMSWPVPSTLTGVALNRISQIRNLGSSAAIPGARTITTGVLQFSPWVTVRSDSLIGDQLLRPLDSAGRPDWEKLAADGSSELAPWPGRSWDTLEGYTPLGASATRAFPWPTAVRIGVSLAGGGTLQWRNGELELARTAAGNRDIDQVFLAAPMDEDDTTVRTRGGPLPAGAGSTFRIGDEWLAVTDIPAPGTATVRRGLRRSTAAAHARGAPVLQGQTFSVVWRLGD